VTAITGDAPGNYRSKRNYIAMIYMSGGKLNFELPT